MIFVESGGRGDFYFNYAHNCNVGIKKAMEYNPKWIVLSNDDMQKMDEVEVLRKELLKLNEKEIDAVFTSTSPTKYHSKPSYIGRPNLLGKIYFYFGNLISRMPYDFWVYLYHRRGNELFKKFAIEYILLPKHWISKIFFTKLYPFYITMSFSIFSYRFVMSKNMKVLNEDYVNGAEDWQVSLELTFHKNISFIDFNIAELAGGTLGTGNQKMVSLRSMRDISNLSLFNFLNHNDLER